MKDIINIFSVLLSPIIAILISILIQKRQAKTNMKVNIFNTLMNYRYSSINEEMTKMFNMIDIAFYKNKHVRKLWKEYYESLCNNNLINNRKDEKRLELIYAMAKDLGYKNEISYLDISRVYNPQAISDKLNREEEIEKQLLLYLLNKNIKFNDHIDECINTNII